MIAEIRKIARDAIIHDGDVLLPEQPTALSEINRHIEALIAANAAHCGPLSEAYAARAEIIKHL